MEYWEGPSESMIGEGTIWTEFSEDGTAVRQVEKYGSSWFSSREKSLKQYGQHQLSVQTAAQDKGLQAENDPNHFCSYLSINQRLPI